MAEAGVAPVGVESAVRAAEGSEREEGDSMTSGGVLLESMPRGVMPLIVKVVSAASISSASISSSVNEATLVRQT